MRSLRVLLYCLPLLTACSPEEPAAPAAPAPAPVSDAVVFEGATLLVGDGTAPITNAVFVVEDGSFTAVGSAGSIDAPAGAERVDLAGKTVIPGLIDAHLHLGYIDGRNWTDSSANFTRDNLVDQLERLAHHGVVAALSMGLDYDAVYELRDDAPSGVARLLTAGAGIARPNASAGDPRRREVPYGVDTPEEGRAAVRELLDRDVDIVKIWVDDRGGTVEKLTPDLYGPIIDEARSLGGQVTAHIFYLEDAKELLRAGLHGFAHGVRDEVVDDEFLGLLGDDPDVFLIPNLPERGRRSEADLAYAAETLPAAALDAMREEDAAFEIDSNELFETQAANLVAMHEAGVLVGFGTDGDGMGFDAHEELYDMVVAGLTPNQVITAATSASAEIVGRDDLGAVAVGKSADFVVLDANPLDDIRNTRRIADVYIAGDAVDRRN